MLGAGLFLALLALRNLSFLRKLLDPVTLKREALALAGLVLPIAIGALASGAPWQDVAVSALTGVGLALGLQPRGAVLKAKAPKVDKVAMLFLALLFVAGCAGLSQGIAAHDATTNMLREDLAAHEAMSECVQKLDAGASQAEVMLCALSAAEKVRNAAEATRCQVEVVDELIDAVEGDAGAGGGG